MGLDNWSRWNDGGTEAGTEFLPDKLLKTAIKSKIYINKTNIIHHKGPIQDV